MRQWPIKLLCLLSLASACKRDEADLNDAGKTSLPGTFDINAAKNLEEQRAAALAAQALEEARLRNEQLNKEIADAKERERLKAEEDLKNKSKDPEKGDGGTTSPAPSSNLGPFTLFKGDQCLGVQGKNLADGAPLGLSPCSGESHQIFVFELADDSGAYRLVPQHSHKCLKVEGASIELGAKLVQNTCDIADLSEQFYVLGINDTDFIIQNLKSQYCFDLQSSGYLTQVTCDPSSQTVFKINKVK